MNQRIHVIPLGHPEPLHHASLGCWCHPLPKEGGEIAIHNAKDGREKWERQGIIDSDKRWAIVYENLGCDHDSDKARELYEYLTKEFVRLGAPSTTLSKVEQLFQLSNRLTP